MKIIIDGDAWPYKSEVIELAKKYSIKTIIIFSVAHFTNKLNIDDKNIDIILTDNRKQEVDIKIMNIAEYNDIVLTNDSGLSYFLVSKGCIVISSYGKIITKEKAEEKLNIAYIKKRSLRSKTRKNKIKGPKKDTIKTKEKFIQVLKKVILQNIKT